MCVLSGRLARCVPLCVRVCPRAIASVRPPELFVDAVVFQVCVEILFFFSFRGNRGATLFLIIHFTYFSHLHTSIDKLRTLNCVTSLSAPKHLKCLSIFRSLSGGFSFSLAPCCYNLSSTCVGLSVVWVPLPFSNAVLQLYL